MPAKDGRSASAAANCLYQAAIGNSTAPTAALLFPGLQTGIGSAVSGRAKSRNKRNALEVSKPFIYKVTEKDTLLQEGQRIFFSYK